MGIRASSELYCIHYMSVYWFEEIYRLFIV
jgi:hypothetical protein